MLNALTSRFSQIFSRSAKKGRLKEADITQVLTEIREALLDADVAVAVVDEFCDAVGEKCRGASLHQALDPTQQIIKAVHDQLVITLGGTTPGEALETQAGQAEIQPSAQVATQQQTQQQTQQHKKFSISYASKPPTVVLLAGLQGAGKTTNAAKLASWFVRQGRSPMLVGTDLQRPAAVEQLRVLAEEAKVPVFSQNSSPKKVAAAGLAEARRLGRDVLICDTAGRLSIDKAMMKEIQDVSKALDPDYTFFVLDSMGGQAAAEVAGEFHRALTLDGVILTKLDSDTRGGAALSVRQVAGCPIVFSSVGERLGDLEEFHPDRLASRILGKGDVMSLIEKTEQAFEKQEAEEAAQRIIEGTYTLEDFLSQMRQIRKLGPLGDLISRMPGAPAAANVDEAATDKRMSQMEAIICSMTPLERFRPELINNSRKRRIAVGSGCSTADVSRLLREFMNARKMMSSLTRPGRKSKKGGRVTPPGTKSKRLPQGALDMAKLEEQLGIELSQLEN